MIKRRILLLLMAGVLVVVGAFVWSLIPSREPEYRGRMLSEWMVIHATGKNPTDKAVVEAETAIRQIGTNAIPYLIEWIQYSPPASKRLLYPPVQTAVRQVDPQWQISDRRLTLSVAAISGFRILGSNAVAAVPELSRILLDPALSNCHVNVAFCLGELGPAAIPGLISAATNRQCSARRTAVYRLLRMAPVLREDPRPASPALVGLLNDPDFQVAAAASNILRTIDPHALENATRSPP